MRVTGFNAELHIGEFVAVLGSAIGFEPRYPDRLTRDEAQRLIRWGQSVPELRDALVDKGHPSYKLLRPYFDVANYFAHEHASDASGEPAAWPERPGRGESTAENPFGHLFPDEIADLLAWAPSSKAYSEAMQNPQHPQHAHVAAMTERATQTAGAIDEPPAAPATARSIDPAAQARLDKLRADPAYLDPRHPDHATVMAAVAREYEASYGKAGAREDGGAAIAPPTRGGAPTPAERIAAARNNPAYWDKGHKDHAAAVQEATAAYAAAFPAAPEGGS
jgi:hypothetical protein